MIVGYARTSTSDQIAGLDDQIRQLTENGCEKIFSEHESGVKSDRPKLLSAIDFIREGDIFVVTKPDRLARSATNLLELVKNIQDKAAEVRILSLGVDTTTPAGKLMLTVLAGMAEFERDLMLERQRAGIARAKAEGRYKGRAPVARRKAGEIARMRAEGMTAPAIAKALGISARSVYRYFVNS